MLTGSLVVVAEAAQGFEGDASLAHLLARAAARAGADQVKFQLVYADELAVPGYQYYDLFRRLEMSERVWESVAAQVLDDGIGIAFDVYGLRSLDLAVAVGARAVKVHSTDFFNERLIAAAVERAPAVYLSIGGIHVDELRERLDSLGAGAEKVTVLSGFQAEPTALADNNLARLHALRDRFPGVRLGFMDHAAADSDEAGWLGLLSVPLGVGLIEKHITLDPLLQLEDHVSALGPTDFARYVRRVRAASVAMGVGDLTLTAAETAYRRRAIKIVVAARPLTPDAAIEEGDVALLRAPLAGDRRPFERIRDVVGRRVAASVDAGAAVYEDQLA